jgi:hypothetical protein
VLVTGHNEAHGSNRPHRVREGCAPGARGFAGFRTRVRLRAAVTLALSSVTSACYSYVPARPTALGRGEQAQVRLTLDGTRQVTSVLGDEVRVVRGVVQRFAPDSIVLLVNELQTLDGQTTTSTGTVVGIPMQHVADATRRVSSRYKTGIAIGMAVGAAVVVYAVARPRGSQGQILPPGGGPNTSLVPR